MAPQAVLIIAEQNDAHALMVTQILRDHCDCEPVILSMSSFPVLEEAFFECGHPLKEVAADVGSVDLSKIKVIWWRRPNRSTAPNDYFVFDKDFLQIECDHFLQGLLWSTNCAWVNHPTDEIFASRKLCQLAEAERIGLSIPRTVITNSFERAKNFIGTFGKALITKRIGTAPGLATKTSLLTADDYERLHTVQTCPTTLQEYIELGGDVRVVVIGSELYSFWIDSAGSANPTDSRLDLTVEHRPFSLPQSQAVLIRCLLKRLGLIFGVVDLRVSPSGEYYFLEVNPSGQYAYLELLTGVPLSEHVARLLAGYAKGLH